MKWTAGKGGWNRGCSGGQSDRLSRCFRKEEKDGAKKSTNGGRGEGIALVLNYEKKKQRKLFGSRDGFSPFRDDGISFVHGHAGIFGEHDGATTTTPRDKIDEMFFAK